MKPPKATMSPTKFRAILISLMVLMLSLGIFGFYTAQATLSSYADDVREKVAEAEASKDSIDQLRNLQAELERLADTRARASSIAADSQSYNYQNQVIADLNSYANQSGVSISKFTFQADGAQSQSTASSARSANSTGATTQAPSGGLKSTTVNITLDSPISYTSLLRFMRSIEQSLTKMQISGISLAPGSDASTVSTDSLNIEVYIR